VRRVQPRRDVTRTPRRRTRRPFAKIVQRYWVLALLVILVTGWGGWRIAGLPAFRMSSLRVTTLAHVTRGEIVAAAAIDPHANVWLLDRHAIERRIEAIPYVATAHVSVRPPAVVELAVSERAIAGCVHDPALHAYTVDAGRYILEARCDAATTPVYDLAAPVASLPGAVLHVPELAALMNDCQTLAAAALAYRGFRHDAFGQLVATLRDGVVVKFGDDTDLGRKERLVGPILAQVETQGRTVRAVDVRAADTPVVEFRPVPAPHPHPVNRL
jgi:cell division septal protein FtsQ